MTTATQLRAVEPTDLEATRVWRSDWSVVRQTFGRVFPITPENESRWYAELGVGPFPTSACWAIQAGARLVGMVQLANISWVHGTSWFGIVIAPDAQGEGHGTRATELCLEIAHRRMNLRQVRLEVAADNDPALRVYSRTGWLEEGRLEGAIREGESVRDVVIMRHEG